MFIINSFSNFSNFYRPSIEEGGQEKTSEEIKNFELNENTSQSWKILSLNDSEPYHLEIEISKKLNLPIDKVKTTRQTINNTLIITLISNIFSQTIDLFTARKANQNFFAGIFKIGRLCLRDLPYIGIDLNAEATSRVAKGVMAESSMRFISALSDVLPHRLIPTATGFAMDLAAITLSNAAIRQVSSEEQNQEILNQLAVIILFSFLTTSLNERLQENIKSKGKALKEKVGQPLALGASAVASRIALKLAGELSFSTQKEAITAIAAKGFLEIAALYLMEGTRRECVKIIALTCLLIGIAQSEILPAELITAMVVGGLCFKIFKAFDNGMYQG